VEEVEDAHDKEVKLWELGDLFFDELLCQTAMQQ
jgi:hypothetical protein